MKRKNGVGVRAVKNGTSLKENQGKTIFNRNGVSKEATRHLCEFLCVRYYLKDTNNDFMSDFNDDESFNSFI